MNKVKYWELLGVGKKIIAFAAALTGAAAAVYFGGINELQRGSYFLGVGLVVFVLLHPNVLKFTILGMSAEFRQTIMEAQTEVAKLRGLAKALAKFADQELSRQYVDGANQRKLALDTYEGIKNTLSAVDFKEKLSDTFPQLFLVVLQDASSRVANAKLSELYGKGISDYSALHHGAHRHDYVHHDTGVNHGHFVMYNAYLPTVNFYGCQKQDDFLVARDSAEKRITELPESLIGRHRVSMHETLDRFFKDVPPLIETGNLRALTDL